MHSYGQRGAGWSLSFGCPGDVATLVEEALLDLPPKAMAIEIAEVDVPEIPAMVARELRYNAHQQRIMARL